MGETADELPPGPLSWLLDGATRGRIAIFLWRRYPQAFTVKEINRFLPFLSQSRIQQVLQKMYKRNVVDRQERKSGKPGPNPLEYKLTPFLYRICKNGFKAQEE